MSSDPLHQSKKPKDASESSSSTHANTLLQGVEKKIEQLEQKLTVFWHEIQPWQQDNHYIHSGYRPESKSYLKSFQSLLYLHNESVNIYTHLIGAIAAIMSSGYLYHELSQRYATATTDDMFVFACFFGGAATCLGMSATYHTISNHSHHVARFGNKLDYLGIVALIWGSFIPTVFYGFQDDIELIRVYWTMVCVSIIRQILFIKSSLSTKNIRLPLLGQGALSYLAWIDSERQYFVRSGQGCSSLWVSQQFSQSSTA